MMIDEKTKKTDHRSRYTQMMIKQSLLKLLAVKQINKISVSELCEAADINRGTFYNHFTDVYDVSDSIEQDFYEQLTEKLDSEKSYKFDDVFFNDIINLLHENMELVKILLTDKSNSSFINHIILHIHKKFSRDYALSHPQLRPRLIDNIMTYTINGSIGIITEWVNNNSAYTKEELAGIIQNFNKVIVSEFIEK